jgi:hypothetical protein
VSSFRKPISVKRTEPGHYGDDGNWVDGAETTLTIYMSVQPLRVDEMDALPEGRRNSRAVKIYSDDELLPAEQTTGQNADFITWQGKQWEVIGCDPYQMGVISHYKSLAVEVKAN